PPVPVPAGGEAGEEPGERERWIAARAALLARAGRPATVAATTLAKEPPVPADPGADAGVEKDEPVDDRPAWRRGRAGTSVGRAVHAVLQTVDLGAGEGLDDNDRPRAICAVMCTGTEQPVTTLSHARELEFGTPVARVLSAPARRLRYVEREVDDLPAAIAAVERRVAELS